MIKGIKRYLRLQDIGVCSCRHIVKGLLRARDVFSRASGSGMDVYVLEFYVAHNTCKAQQALEAADGTFSISHNDDVNRDDVIVTFRAVFPPPQIQGPGPPLSLDPSGLSVGEASGEVYLGRCGLCFLIM